MLTDLLECKDEYTGIFVEYMNTSLKNHLRFTLKIFDQVYRNNVVLMPDNTNALFVLCDDLEFDDTIDKATAEKLMHDPSIVKNSRMPLNPIIQNCQNVTINFCYSIKH